MKRSFTHKTLHCGLLAALFAVVLVSCSTAQPEPEYVVVTVPVEVTREVPIVETVEVTREVIVTQVVEVPVTQTAEPAPPATAEASPAPEASPTATLAPVYPTATMPAVKGEGFAPLKMVNETAEDLVLELSGTMYRSFSLPARKTDIQIVPEGDYTYQVMRAGKVVFRGTMAITNPDKHEFHFRSDKVLFLVP